jgi:phosphatidylinositol alpha-1,6-mannosyltransferase
MILLLAPTYPPVSGGVPTLMEGLAEALGAHDEVIVLGKGDRVARAYDTRGEAPAALRVERFGGALAGWRMRRRAGRLATQARAIFAQSWESLEDLPAGLAAPVVCFGHGDEFPEDVSGARKAKALRAKARIRAALARASALALVSRDTQARARPYFEGVCAPHLIHPPIRPLAAASPQDCAWAAKRWRGSGPRLLSLSRLVGFKGIDTTLRVFAALRSEFPGLDLVVAGDGPMEASLKALAAELGIAEAVAFVGRVEGGAKTALLHSAHVYMQPGRVVDGAREGFGLTYVEAGLAGLPAIAGEAGGAPDAVEHGKSGLVVDASRLEDVVKATRALVGDNAIRARLSEGARRKAARGVWDVKIADYLALIDPT